MNPTVRITLAVKCLLGRAVLCCSIAVVHISASPQSSAYSFEAARHFSGLQDDKYGWSIANSPMWVMVGIPWRNSDLGAVAIYSAPAFANISIPAIDTIFPTSADWFGASLACSDSDLAVSHCSHQGGSEYCDQTAEAVELFHWTGTEWEQQASIVRPAWAVGGDFGKAVALSGNWLAVGGTRSNTGQGLRDVVYLYEKTGIDFGTTPVDSLVGASLGDAFGHALAFDADLLLVGSEDDDENGTDAGAAYVFGKDVGGLDQWGLVRKLLASNGLPGDHFGAAVALRNGRCAVGAPGAVMESQPEAGAAYVFDQDLGFANNWGEAALLSPDPVSVQAQLRFGSSVALGDDVVAVGAPVANVGGSDDGWVEMFEVDGGGAWPLVQRIVPVTDQYVSSNGRCGTSLAFNGPELLIGAPWADVLPQDDPGGGVLVYERLPVGIPEQAARPGLVWPNPFTDRLQIRWPLAGKSVVYVLIADAQGRAVLRRRVGVQNHVVVLEDIAVVPGAYVLHLDVAPGVPGIRLPIIATAR